MSLFASSARSWNPTPGVSYSQWGQPQSVRQHTGRPLLNQPRPALMAVGGASCRPNALCFCWSPPHHLEDMGTGLEAEKLDVQVRFSECGERFAAIGEGGVVAAWRVDAPRLAASDTGSLGRAEWCHQVLPSSCLLSPLSGDADLGFRQRRTLQGLTKRGVDVTYVAGSTSVLAVGGFCQQGNVVIWDTLAAATAAPIARLFHHANMVTSLQVILLPEGVGCRRASVTYPGRRNSFRERGMEGEGECARYKHCSDLELSDSHTDLQSSTL